MASEDELTMIPMKLTKENDRGTVMSWGHTAAEGYLAREAKSGALLEQMSTQTVDEDQESTYVTNVAILLMHDIRLATIVHPSSDPCTVAGRDTIGPTPFAFTMHHMKNVMPAMGVTIAFSVNKWRL